MSVAAGVIAIIASLCCCAKGQYPPLSQPSSNLEGVVCTPPFGYERNTCGSEVLIEQINTTLPPFLYGPNTCQIVKRSSARLLEYRYQRFCSHVFDYYQYRYVQHCQVFCQATSTCTNDTRIIERGNIECCPGFQVRPASDPSHYDYIYRVYYTPIKTPPVGCPRAVGDSILDCLELLNLTTFIGFVNESIFLPLIGSNSSDVEFTVFAPTNAAFDAIQDQLEDVNITALIGNHILEGTVMESDLLFDKRFTTMNDLTVHSTTVVFGDRTLYVHNPLYSQYNDPSNLVRYTTIRFIGGARVVNGDACVTESGGTLQVIDRVLMPGMESIADILEGNDDFAMFTEALRASGFFSFLDHGDVSRTVFVPTNEAFATAIPMDLFTCLMYQRVLLNDIVLYHIARGAEYTPSLSLRQFTHTLQLQPIRLNTDENGTITLINERPSTLIMPDIPASNGVVHVVDNVLIPPNFNFGKCEEFVPTTPPPTTQPTTMPPTTPPTAPPTTATSVSPTTSLFLGGSGQNP